MLNTCSGLGGEILSDEYVAVESLLSDLLMLIEMRFY